MRTHEGQGHWHDGGTYPQHDAMLDVQEDLLLLPVVPDEGMQGVTVGDPANEARVGRQRDDCVPLDAGGHREEGSLHGGHKHTSGQLKTHNACAELPAARCGLRGPL